MEIFAKWRFELEAELAVAQRLLEENLNALEAAETVVAAAKLQRRRLTDAIGRIGPHPTLAGALQIRIQDHDNALRQVDAQLTRARNDVKSGHARIKDLKEALEQLDRMLPEPKPIDAPMMILTEV